MRRACVAFIFAVFLLFLASTARVHAHPKPGAHADVRIDVGRDSVRFDVQMNLLFADGLLSVPRARRDELLAEEEPLVLRGVSQYFGTPTDGPNLLTGPPNRVTIDNQHVGPVIRELSVVRPTIEERPGFVQNPALLIPRVHIVAEYPASSRPREAVLEWGVFPRDFLAQDRDIAPPGEIEAVVSGEGRFELIRFTKAEPRYHWRSRNADLDDSSVLLPVPAVPKAPRRGVPLVSALLVAFGAAASIGAGVLLRGDRVRRVQLCAIIGLACVIAAGHAGVNPGSKRITFPWWSTLDGGQVDPASALSVFGPLHANIYRAFDYTDEREIYDALATSVDGPLLERVYTEVYEGLVIREEGGAVCKVKAVEPVATEVAWIGSEAATGAPAFRVNSRWRVEGVVYHWGHSHERTNEYAAIYTVAARAGAWRIVGAEPVEQRRVQGQEQAASPAATETTSGHRPQGETWRPNR